ncbi:hypothetical protein Gotur_025338 [Gossypium turneri]
MASRIYLRQRRGRQDYEGSPAMRPRQSPGSSSMAMQSPSPTKAPTQSPDAAIQQMTPTQPPFPMMPGLFPSPYMYPNPYMYPFPNPMAGWCQMPSSAPFPVTPSGSPISRPAAQEGSQGGRRGALLFTNHHQRMDAEPELPESPPEEEQSPPEARGRRNPARNRRRPPCGTEFPGHRH